MNKSQTSVCLALMVMSLVKNLAHVKGVSVEDLGGSTYNNRINFLENLYS